MSKRNLFLATAAGIGVAVAARALLRGPAYSFRNRVVLITGGSRGLGLVMARQLADEGARLAIVARDAAELGRAEQELRERGAEVLAFTCDVRDREQAQAAVERVVAHYGAIEVLVNNAGIIQVGPIDHATDADFENSLAVHFWGPLSMIQAARPHMRNQGGGRIVNISSIGGLVSTPHLIPYCAGKHALVGLSDGLRAELAHENIIISTVCPGLMRTGSHYNALFKGRHQSEFTWFSIIDSLPFSSIDAPSAAREIIEACRHGTPHLTVTFQARLIAAADALAPNLMAQALKLYARLLPNPTGPEGDEVRSGWESQSALAPSPLTALNDRATAENNGL